MEHASGFISTLVIGLVCAFAGGLAARSVRLPPLVGYLAAGMLIGPFTPGFVANQAVAAELAEVGVALLLFNIGLHFSIKDMMSVRKIAVMGALVQVLITSIAGTVLALQLLGSSLQAALMLGLSVAIASTAVSTRILDEKHQLTTFAGRVALGWLVVQDIVVILALVLFPVVAKTQDLEAGAFLTALGRTFLQVAGFVVVMMFGGRRLIPWLLSAVAKIGSRELFTLSVIVIALGIAYGSSVLFGVSLALGAFFAGLLIGESDLNHHAASEALSMQQVFTVLFFVSVGMLFDPSTLLRMPMEIVSFWVVIVVALGLVTLLLMMAFHIQPEGSGVVGGAFAQIGEFSFVLSELGLGWGILAKDERDLILAVAIVSIVLNPVISYLYPRLARFLAGLSFVSRWLKHGEAHLPGQQDKLVGHVILVGHGRVGHLVSEALKKHAIPCVIIESDRRIMEKLREMNETVIFGDAAREAVLGAAHPETARLMVLAMPEGSQVRRIAMQARRLFPDLQIIVRVHADHDVKALNKLGVELSVMGEREVALGLSAYALQLYGIESHMILETMSALREEPLAFNS